LRTDSWYGAEPLESNAGVDRHNEHETGDERILVAVLSGERGSLRANRWPLFSRSPVSGERWRITDE
jgi:hypothetical protein